MSWDDFPQPQGRAWWTLDNPWEEGQVWKLTKVHAFRELLIDPGGEFDADWILPGSVTVCGITVAWGSDLQPEQPVECLRCLRTLDRLREAAQ